MTTDKIEKGRKVRGAEREALAGTIVTRYTAGESIRALATSTGRSYGAIHRLIRESGTAFRSRGGFHPKKHPHT